MHYNFCPTGLGASPDYFKKENLMTNSHPIYLTDDSREYYFEERCHILEIMNSPQAPELSIARARVGPGVTTVLHALDRTEVYYILEGHGEVRVGNQRTTVKPGAAVYIARGIPQQITNTTNRDLVFLALCTPRFSTESYTSLEEIEE
jgi:mannose-6-phosphate isomerase-like protein (cupin superfamily)